MWAAGSKHMCALNVSQVDAFLSQLLPLEQPTSAWKLVRAQVLGVMLTWPTWQPRVLAAMSQLVMS